MKYKKNGVEGIENIESRDAQNQTPILIHRSAIPISIMILEVSNKHQCKLHKILRKIFST